MNKILWVAQILLALLFLLTGVSKLVMPVDQMTAAQVNVHLSGAFLRFIGAVETLGAVGLILPWLLRIRPGLTPLATAGLTIIMIGAVTTTLMEGNYVASLLSLVTGLLTAFVAWGRWRQLRRHQPFLE